MMRICNRAGNKKKERDKWKLGLGDWKREGIK